MLTACAPLQNLMRERIGNSSSSGLSSSRSSSTSPERVELPVEIEEESSSAATGSGALAERMADRGILEIGNKDSPLVLTVFTNYSCDYCEEFMRDMFPRLQSDYMNDGRLRMQIVIVPLKKYPNSSLEASGLLCASALEKGQVMHEALRTANVYDRKSLLTLAKKLQLPAKQFAACLSAKETNNLLEQQKSFIQEQTVTLIPTFLLNVSTPLNTGSEKRVGLMFYPDLRGWIRSK